MSSTRLDKFLQDKFPQHSRSLIKKLIKDGTVVINQKIIKKPHFIISSNDQIDLDQSKWLRERTQIIPNPKIKLNIIYQDKNILVINKPPGLIIHPRQTKDGFPHPNDLKKTLVSGLLYYFPQIANVGDLPQIRPGIVHRLDKDTSGIIIIAKNQSSFEYLKKQFKERLVKKEYLAVVGGKIKNKNGTLEDLLLRSKRQPLKQKVSFNRQGKRAILKYKVIQENNQFSLVKIRLITGRTHQIRVQFANFGHPIVGDKAYAPKPISSLASRQLLHSYTLSIALPSGETKTFTTPIPDDIQNILNL